MFISLNKGREDALKDTAVNILARREFVVHIADEDIGQQMHDCGAELPPTVSELDVNGLTTAASCSPPGGSSSPVGSRVSALLYGAVMLPSTVTSPS